MTDFAYQPPPSLDDPYSDEWTQPFWDAALREQLAAPKCTQCGTFKWTPEQRFCANCMSQDFEWVDLPGTGTLYSFIVVRHPLRPDMQEHVPYIPAVIEPDGAPGIRMTSNVVDIEPGDVACDMKLKVVWNRVSDTLCIPFWTEA
jgi:uncharacterized OB-fold protein